ncbi:LCP family protein [Streptomyces sp. NPDC021224]|uniref:LCP family protein n=1 Tax=unclassified Streptomyces TaxID=2593676 RepID=UPI00379CFCA9
MPPTSRHRATAVRPHAPRGRVRQAVPAKPAPRGGRPGRRPPIRLSTRIVGGLAVLVITVSGVGHTVVTSVSGAIGRVDAFGGMQGRPNGSKGTNFLLVGTDGRDDLAPAQKQAYHLGGAPCHCTDTIMLVHLSQDRSRASVVSIPRDTYVLLPSPATEPGTRPPRDPARAARAAAGHDPRPPAAPAATHPAKLNQAYAQGGPKLTVQTVEQLTGVHVDHYLEVDFTSFMKTVDVLGGVPVCTTKPLKDPWSGLNLPAGTTVLNGGQALQYVRSRHTDPAADLGRMQRQQRFVAQVVGKITSEGMLADPLKLSKVVSTVLGSVRADQGLDTGDMLGLARAMKGFSPRSSEYTTVPLSSSSVEVPGLGSTVRWDPAKAGKLWADVRADRPLAAPAPADPAAPAGTPAATPVAVDPATVRVAVENGTGVPGLAGDTQRALHATGFATTGAPATAHAHVPHTVIRFDPQRGDAAKALAVALPGAQLAPTPELGPVLRVTLGPDFALARVRPVLAPPPDPGTRPQDGVLTGDRVGCA